MGGEETNKQVLVSLSTWTKWEKILSSTILIGFVGIIVWVTNINRSVAEINTIKNEVKKIQDTLPAFTVKQMVRGERDKWQEDRFNAMEKTFNDKTSNLEHKLDKVYDILIEMNQKKR